MTTHESLDAGVFNPPPNPPPINSLFFQIFPKCFERPLVANTLFRRLIVFKILIIFVHTKKTPVLLIFIKIKSGGLMFEV